MYRYAVAGRGPISRGDAPELGPENMGYTSTFSAPDSRSVEMKAGLYRDSTGLEVESAVSKRT